MEIVGIKEDDGMGMMISRSGFVNSHNQKEITIQNRDGTTAGVIIAKGPSKKKPKRVPYNLKEISTQIMRARTSSNAKKITSKAHSKLALLRQKLTKDEYDNQELKNAIAHALKMEKIAKKKMRHLQQEERMSLKNSGANAYEDIVEEKLESSEAVGNEQELKEQEKKLRELMQEYEKLMKQSIEQSKEVSGSDELLDEVMGALEGDASPEDLEKIKKKHRAEELKDILEADLKYLKAMFDKLSREKQTSSSGSFQNSDSSGVSLELVGVDVPVETAEVPVVQENAVDVTV